ncbi:MAG: hypothetical protein IKZ02_04960 [Alphaproteobacteria bacterium]|nr:hypothetical protein [Alphaproteobacteria bacterium]
MKLKNTLLMTSALTPILFSACDSSIHYLATANSFIPAEDAFIVKKAEMENSINGLTVTQNRKAQLRQILNSFGETSHGHHIITGAQQHTQFAVSNNIPGVAAYATSTNQIIIKNNDQAKNMNNIDWYCSVSHELLHSYQRNHALGLLQGISPQQYLFIIKLYEAEAYSLEKFGDNLWSAGRCIRQLMSRDSADLMWSSFYEPTLMEDLKRAAERGLLTSHGNPQAIQHTLDYFKQVYGIDFDNSDIERGGISDYRIEKFRSICNQISESGVLEKGNQAFAIKQQMANKFEQYVEHAPSEQSIVNYFCNFSVIKPSHIEEAQVLLNSDNIHAMGALQTLITNGFIKGNLDRLEASNELKQQELTIIRQSVLETWQARRIQAQRSR